jgi:hypothetical protein
MEEAAVSTENDHVSEVVGMFVTERCRLLGRLKPFSFAPIVTQAVIHRLFNASTKAHRCAASRSTRGNVAVGSNYEQAEPPL